MENTGKISLRVVFLAALASVLMCIFAADASNQPTLDSLPDVPGWTGSATQLTSLKSAEKEEGRMLERSYRKNGTLQTVTVVLLEGSGTSWLTFPEEAIDATDGPFGTGSTYRTLKVRGKEAVLENHPIQGKALAIKLDTSVTLTIEMSSDEALLLEFAHEIIELAGF
ncbi:MAG TPA: hypothetical protein DCE03_01300 [Synergistaceae bacterium]|jgi:hypothetical protein|nr:MAG: hypothetical protein XE12_0014 [Synergistales bacterium 54_9]MDK2845560.1 hypothetical protein [Synergistales bacterium]MDN5335310.1 hypothetical protein [Synergistales bacterium]HAA47121.1 hypothetical protein [Synergistaceae bacterium]